MTYNIQYKRITPIKAQEGTEFEVLMNRRVEEAKRANAERRAKADFYFSQPFSFSNLIHGVYNYLRSDPMLFGENENPYILNAVITAPVPAAGAVTAVRTLPTISSAVRTAAEVFPTVAAIKTFFDMADQGLPAESLTNTAESTSSSTTATPPPSNGEKKEDEKKEGNTNENNLTLKPGLVRRVRLSLGRKIAGEPKPQKTPEPEVDDPLWKFIRNGLWLETKAHNYGKILGTNYKSRNFLKLVTPPAVITGYSLFYPEDSGTLIGRTIGRGEGNITNFGSAVSSAREQALNETLGTAPTTGRLDTIQGTPIDPNKPMQDETGFKKAKPIFDLE